MQTYSVDLTKTVKDIIPAMQSAMDSTASNFSGTTAPTPKFVGQQYYDTANKKLYICTAIADDGTGTWTDIFSDMIAAAKWFSTQANVDAKNIGIWGWSFGGFMSSLCIMKGADIFTTAIAIAPVTNWRFYDSIYTERYMRTPSENESGYDANSPMNYVNQLKGNLLICHGTADDNVHVQNTYELSERLVQANKQFDMAIYTNRNHSIYGGNTTLQLYNRFVKYLKDHMQ